MDDRGIQVRRAGPQDAGCIARLLHDFNRERGADGIDLNTGESDTAARSLYESMGFSNREGSPHGPSMLFYERAI